jgi:hypothetical protein
MNTTMDRTNICQKQEMQVIGRLIDDAISMGCTFSVNDGEVWTVKHSTNKKEVMSALRTTDSDTLRIRYNGDKLTDVMFVYGNDGYDVIADYTLSATDKSRNQAIEKLMSGCNDLADKLSE